MIQIRIFVSCVAFELLRVPGGLIATTNGIFGVGFFFAISLTTATIYAHLLFIWNTEELEVKFDSCNSKMENNCFSDNFIGREHFIATLVFPYILEWNSNRQIKLENETYRKKKYMYMYSKREAKLVLNENGSNDAHSIWN